MPGRAAMVARAGGRVLSFCAALYLFVLAIQFMKAGAAALAPDLDGAFPVNSAVSTLGLGWIGAYLVLSGSPVAAVALSLYAASAIGELQAFSMLSGSRLGASFVVLLVGFLYAMKSRDRRESTGMGILALSLTAVVYLPAMLLGYGILKMGLLSGVDWTAGGELQGLVERWWGSALALAVDHLAGWLLFPVGLAALLVSFKLLDRVLPQLDGGWAARKRARWLESPWAMFALGSLVAVLTLSVSVAITVLVPLAAKGFVDRRQAIPYIMGANITTLADTLVAAMILGRPEGVQVVLAEAIAVTLVTLVCMLFLYRPLTRAVMALDDWILGRVQRLVVFVGGIFLLPTLLVLSGPLFGIGQPMGQGGGRLQLSLLATVLVALPVWALVDAVTRPRRFWQQVGARKGVWLALLGAGAPTGLGFLLGLRYLTRIRPRLSTAELVSFVAVWGDEAR